METNSNEDKLEGWTKEEKLELLEAIREGASITNVEQIKEFVYNKTEEEIRAALDFYLKKPAVHISNPSIKKKKRKMRLPMVPLSSWAKFITDTHGLDNTETSAALRLIADFEDKPPAILTDKIDFKNLYHILADTLEGKPLPYDKYIWPILKKCITETALSSKALNRGSTCFKQVLQESCNPAKVDMNSFSKPTDNVELATLRFVSSRKNYNPLNIPENYLRCSSHTQ